MDSRRGCSSLIRHKFLLFFCSSITGMIFAFALLKPHESDETDETDETSRVFVPSQPKNNFEQLYDKWLHDQGLRRIIKNDENFKEEEEEKSLREDIFLKNKIRVLCIVLSKDRKRARAVKRTWIEHCDSSAFFGSYNDETVPVSQLPNVEPWPLLCGALLRSLLTFRNNFHWMIVVDDRSFVMVENLRSIVAPLVNSSDLFYLGHPVKDTQSDFVYNLGTAGFALNHRAVEAIAQNIPDDDACDALNDEETGEDCILGKLMHQIGAAPLDTRDRMARARFNAFNVAELLLSKRSSKFEEYAKNSLYLSSRGENCCSEYAVTFHDIPPTKMYLLEYLIYHLRPRLTWTENEEEGKDIDHVATLETISEKKQSRKKPDKKLTSSAAKKRRKRNIKISDSDLQLDER